MPRLSLFLLQFEQRITFVNQTDALAVTLIHNGLKLSDAFTLGVLPSLRWMVTVNSPISGTLYPAQV
ncbi:hypothetical protein OFY05_23375 (plasmid) [Pseudocitrobacter faecalis]|nr:hypothetical protein OFY05_23375 [Pseudocitrobacter faecalis]